MSQLANQKVVSDILFSMKKFILFILFSIFLTACSKKQEENLIRIAYMPNVTHAIPLVAIEKGIFNAEFGNEVKVKPIHFIVGNSIIDAFITGQIDVAYVGPGPYINALYRKVPLKLLANSCNGGTTIVGLSNCSSLQKGLRISVPQYGNTQDLILRKFLENENIESAMIIAIPPQDTATAFFTMSIDCACVPEPWGTVLEDKAKCKIIKNEKEVLDNGNYPVTILVTTEEYAKKHPDIIKKIKSVNNRTIDYINSNPEETIEITRTAISKISKKELKKEIISRSISRCTFKDEIDLSVLKEYAEIGVKTGYYRNDLLKRFN